MIRANTGGNRELQLASLGHTLGCQVGGPERLRDHDFCVDQFSLKHAVRTVLVGGDDQRVTLRLEKLAQAELAGHAPEQLPRPEIDRLGRWSSLTAGVALNVRNVIACIRSGIPRNGIFVKHTDDLGHGSPPQSIKGGTPRILRFRPRLRHAGGRTNERTRSLRWQRVTRSGGWVGLPDMNFDQSCARATISEMHRTIVRRTPSTSGYSRLRCPDFGNT